MDLLHLVSGPLLFDLLVIECGSRVGGPRHCSVDDDGRVIGYRWDGGEIEYRWMRCSMDRSVVELIEDYNWNSSRE